MKEYQLDYIPSLLGVLLGFGLGLIVAKDKREYFLPKQIIKKNLIAPRQDLRIGDRVIVNKSGFDKSKFWLITNVKDTDEYFIKDDNRIEQINGKFLERAHIDLNEFSSIQIQLVESQKINQDLKQKYNALLDEFKIISKNVKSLSLELEETRSKLNIYRGVADPD